MQRFDQLTRQQVMAVMLGTAVDRFPQTFNGRSVYGFSKIAIEIEGLVDGGQRGRGLGALRFERGGLSPPKSVPQQATARPPEAAHHIQAEASGHIFSAPSGGLKTHRPRGRSSPSRRCSQLQSVQAEDERDRADHAYHDQGPDQVLPLFTLYGELPRCGLASLGAGHHAGARWAAPKPGQSSRRK